MSESVRMWRPAGCERLLLMAGSTPAYAVEPRGMYVVGVIDHGAMRLERAGRRHVAQAGDVVACDPSHAHRGVALDVPAWACRLMVIELPTLEALLDDSEERIPLPACETPVIRDRRLAAGFQRLHRALDGPAS